MIPFLSLLVAAQSMVWQPSEAPEGDAITSARNDLIRDNIYWKAYEGPRIVVTAIAHSRKRPTDPDAPPTRTLADRVLSNRLTNFVSMR